MTFHKINLSISVNNLILRLMIIRILVISAMSWTSWSARLSSLALNLPKVLASQTNQSGSAGHGDRYIGSLFRVDEPVSDDSFNPSQYNVIDSAI